jgi:hypothetical protein
MRRPPSLSEGCISIGDYNFLNDKIEPLTLTIRDTIQEEVSKPVIVVKEEHTWEEIIADYTLRFLLHISLISFFETIFFFKFVSVDEDKGITQITDFYINKILNSCNNLNTNETAFLNIILNKIINATNINSLGISASSHRSLQNNLLYKKSWSYFGGISGVFVFLSLISVIRAYKIRWPYMIIENLIFVSMLGIYELIFFLNIIKQYGTTTPQEITMGFVYGLQTTCGLLN